MFAEHVKQGTFDRIDILTYGRNDRAVLDGLDLDDRFKQAVHFIEPDQDISSAFGALCHSLNISKIKEAVRGTTSFVRTNQINGSWSAWIAKLCGAKFLLRCGYILSRRLFKNKKYPQSLAALVIEFIGFNMADIASVTTQDAKAYISTFTLNKTKCFVAPTYVNTDVFSAKFDSKPDDNSVVFVGRLEAQKNVLTMVEAAAIAKVPLIVVGKGSRQDTMLAQAKELGVALTHHPSMQNDAIAELLQRHRYFLLPSLHEGLPKVLIEAMAAEMVCIGTPTSGTNALIHHADTGYLSEDFSAQSIAQAISKALSDPNHARYAKNARAFILKNHTIAAYAAREKAVMDSVLS